MPIDDTAETQPSYGLIGISRYTCGGKGMRLVGSSIEHNNFISIKITGAERDRHHSRDWFHSNGPIMVECYLSQSQFAELITSMNMGDGVPCTLAYVNGERVPEPIIQSKRTEFLNEFNDAAKEVGKKFDRVQALAETLLEKPNITKSKEVIAELKLLRQEIDSNIPFLGSQFNNQMSKTVAEARGEIEAHMLKRAHDMVVSTAATNNLSGDNAVQELPD